MGAIPRGVATELGGVDMYDDQDRFLNPLGLDSDSGLTPWDAPVLQPGIATERGAEGQGGGRSTWGPARRQPNSRGQCQKSSLSPQKDAAPAVRQPGTASSEESKEPVPATTSGSIATTVRSPITSASTITSTTSSTTTRTTPTTSPSLGNQVMSSSGTGRRRSVSLGRRRRSSSRQARARSTASSTDQDARRIQDTDVVTRSR